MSATSSSANTSIDGVGTVTIRKLESLCRRPASCRYDNYSGRSTCVACAGHGRKTTRLIVRVGVVPATLLRSIMTLHTIGLICRTMVVGYALVVEDAI